VGPLSEICVCVEGLPGTHGSYLPGTRFRGALRPTRTAEDLSSTAAAHGWLTPADLSSSGCPHDWLTPTPPPTERAADSAPRYGALAAPPLLRFFRVALRGLTYGWWADRTSTSTATASRDAAFGRGAREKLQRPLRDAAFGRGARARAAPAPNCG